MTRQQEIANARQLDPAFLAAEESIWNGTHPANGAPSCTTGTIIGYDPESDTIQLIPATCGRWDCPHCAEHKAHIYYARIMRADPERRVTLTWWTAVLATPLDALKQMKTALRKLAWLLRNGDPDRNGKPRMEPRVFEYAAIWERHKSGFPHLHLATWGDFVKQSYLSELWERLTGASNTDIRLMSPDTQDRHHWTKYMLKQAPVTATLFKGRRLISFSEGYDRNGKCPSGKLDGARVSWRYTGIRPLTVARTLLSSLMCLPAVTDLDGSLFSTAHLRLPAGAFPLWAALLSDSPETWARDCLDPPPDLPPEPLAWLEPAPRALDMFACVIPR